MGSFGMNWNQKNSMVWDWENLAPSVPNEITRHGSANSSGGTLTSSSELGHGSSKSSISASIDSPCGVGNSLEFNFAAVERNAKDMGKNGRVDDSRPSPSSMIAFSHGEPSISLKLGKRAYFENVCGRQDVKNSSPSTVTSAPSTVTSAPTVVKKTKVSQQNAKNSYCQVEGCKVDLSSAKDYHRKHKVCETHAKAPKVVVAGLERRFCQQCSRFHGLAEFDQNKRSCRRRLTHHNARRRKPQADTISFNSSRLATMFYDTSQRTNLFFSQPLYGQVRSNAVSSWDNSGGLKFMETKNLSMQQLKTAGLDELHFSTPQISTSVVAQAVHHHNFDGPMPFKGSNTKVLNQGVEAASAATPNSNGAPGLGRALSLLSDGSWGSSPTVIHQANPHAHAGAMPPLATVAAVSNNAGMHPLDPSLQGRFWQDYGPPQLDGAAQIQAFAHL